MQNTQSWQVAHILDLMKKKCMQTCQLVIVKHSDDVCIMNTHQNKSILEKLNLDRCACRMHAGCMQPVKIKLLRTVFDWSYQVFLNHLPTSACFFTFFILLPLTPCAISYSYFFLHQKLLYPQIGKFKSLLYHVKNLHVDLSKFWLTETQKWCRIFFEKEEVLAKNPWSPQDLCGKFIVL